MSVQTVHHIFFPGFFIPFNFLPDLAKDLNLSSHQGALLISLIAVTNTVTRLLVGYVSDQSWADALIINNIALMIGGAATVGVPFYTGFSLLVVYTVLFGAAIGSYKYNIFLIFRLVHL